uniref:GRHL1/CP2 C-terminal domain-containing protein n=1 Tax=Fundulus heteroclitus TaxID=8078 RepID=A0A3Q2NNY1_FUNHE
YLQNSNRAVVTLSSWLSSIWTQNLNPSNGSSVCSAVYHALYLEERTLVDLSEKIAGLYNITPQQISQIYQQKPTGIHILVSDEMVQNLGEEASFLISTIRGKYAAVPQQRHLQTALSVPLNPADLLFPLNR